MWVSTQSTDGDIGGVNGATAICETDASGIVTGLTHRAVIATSSNDPRNYFSNNPPVQRPDATVITDTYADFFDTAVTARAAVSQAGATTAWTGINTSGIPSMQNCTSWTNGTTGSAQVARSDLTGAGRVSNSGDPCSDPHKLLCVSH